MKKLLYALIATAPLATEARAAAFAEYDLTFTGSGFYSSPYYHNPPIIDQQVYFENTVQIVVGVRSGPGYSYLDCGNGTVPHSSCGVTSNSVHGSIGGQFIQADNFSVSAKGSKQDYQGLPFFDEITASSFFYLGGGHYDGYRLYGQSASITTKFFDADFHGTGIMSQSLYTTSLPEPASWLMMIAGFGMVGGAIRRTRRWAVSFA